MNHFRTSDGTRVSKAEIDRKVRAAKEEKLKQQREELGYNVCTICFRNDCVPIDCSHNLSVDFCQKHGCAEKAWDLENISITGRRHHQQKDGLDLRFKNSNL